MNKNNDDLYRELHEINKSLQEINERQKSNEKSKFASNMVIYIASGIVFLIIFIFHPISNQALSIAFMAYILQLIDFIRN